MESLPGVATKGKYLRKGDGNKWRNPSGNGPAKNKISEPNGEYISKSAAIRMNHVEVSIASCDEELESIIRNEATAEMAHPVLPMATFRSMHTNDVGDKNSPTVDTPTPAAPVRGEVTLEDFALSRRMPYTNPFQIASQEWGKEDLEVPLSALPDIRRLQARIDGYQKEVGQLKNHIETLLKEHQSVVWKLQKERKEEAEEARKKEQEEAAHYQSILNTLLETKKKHEAELKELRDQSKQTEEGLHNQIRALKNALGELIIQNQSQGKPSSFTEIGSNKKVHNSKETPDSHETGKDQHSTLKGHKDSEKVFPTIQTAFLTLNKQHGGSVKEMPHETSD